VSLLADCSFETAVAVSGGCTQYAVGMAVGGWTVMGQPGTVSLCSMFESDGLAFPPEDGAQAMDLTGWSNVLTGVEQTVVTTPGTTYLLAFWVGNQYNQKDPIGQYGATSTVQVFLDGNPVFAAANNQIGAATLAWKEYQYSFTATSGTTTIAFVNADPPTDTSNFIDNVTLVALP
jgi:hypothetical protein